MRRAALVFFAALGLLADSATAKAVTVDPTVMLGGLTDAQLECIASPARRKVLTGGRRSGKTETVIAALTKRAAEGGACVYISLTRKLAKRTVWKRLKARLRDAGVAFKPNESELRLDLPGGGSIELGGADDKEAIERYRGPAYDLVVIDECGSHPGELLRTLVTEVLRPALMDHRGVLLLAGTPGRVLEGFWFEHCGPHRTSAAPKWEWTIYDNPLFAGREDEELAAVRDENAWDENSVSYRREYLGEWIQDDGVLVYPYDAERNGLDRLPERTTKGYALGHRGWRHVISVDVGTTKESMAIVVMAAHAALPDDYIVHGEAHTAMLTDALVGRLRVLLARFPRATLVLDAGGMGAYHALDLNNRPGISVVAAKKQEKASAIRVLRDRLMAGRVKVLNLPGLLGLLREWRTLGWDDDHLKHHPSQADHYSDAALYALRELRNYNTREDMERPEPEPGSYEAELLAEDRESEQIERGEDLAEWEK